SFVGGQLSVWMLDSEGKFITRRAGSKACLHAPPSARLRIPRALPLAINYAKVTTQEPDEESAHVPAEHVHAVRAPDGRFARAPSRARVVRGRSNLCHHPVRLYPGHDSVCRTG